MAALYDIVFFICKDFIALKKRSAYCVAERLSGGVAKWLSGYVAECGAGECAQKRKRERRVEGLFQSERLWLGQPR